MTDAIYYTILAILVALFSPFVFSALKANSRESKLINENSTLKEKTSQSEAKNNEILISKNKEISDLTVTKSELEDIIHEQQKQITEQERKLRLFSKYTFDFFVGIFRLGDRGYCPVCLFKFIETPLGVPGNQVKCPSCDTDYSQYGGFIDVNPYFTPPNDT